MRDGKNELLDHVGHATVAAALAETLYSGTPGSLSVSRLAIEWADRVILISDSPSHPFIELAATDVADHVSQWRLLNEIAAADRVDEPLRQSLSLGIFAMCARDQDADTAVLVRSLFHLLCVVRRTGQVAWEGPVYQFDDSLDAIQSGWAQPDNTLESLRTRLDRFLDPHAAQAIAVLGLGA